MLLRGLAWSKGSVVVLAHDLEQNTLYGAIFCTESYNMKICVTKGLGLSLTPAREQPKNQLLRLSIELNQTQSLLLLLQQAPW